MMKRILILLLALTLAFAFVSCEKDHYDDDGDGKCDGCGEVLEQTPPACAEHKDTNSDGKCDDCGATVENSESNGNSLVLIENGTAKFKVVFQASLGSSMRKAINTFASNMGSAGVDVVAEADKNSEATSIEVLVGAVTNRGEEYVIDKHTLGEEGYIVKMVGTKIIVFGGTDDALEDAFDAFVEDYIGYNKGNAPTNLTVTSKNDIIKIQDDYRITSVSVNGVDLKGYNLVFSGKNLAGNYSTDYENSVTTLQEILYTKAGYWLPIENEIGEKSVVIAAVEDAGADGFRVLVRGNCLYIECAYNNSYKAAYEKFISSNISIKQGDINFASNFSYTEKISTVSYKAFGAVANGVDNDFFAIKAAHEYANEGGQKVVADYGTYLIKETNGQKIIIKTDTDWSRAKFTIDDSFITDRNAPERTGGIFLVASDYSTTEFLSTSGGKAGETIRAINAAAKNGIALKLGDIPTIDLGLGYPAMLTIYNSTCNQYIRYGGGNNEGNSNNGSAQHEIVMVDKYGKGSADTAILHDFTEITSIVVTRIDDKPITIKGGEFTTIANKCVPISYDSFSRGITVSRSNTTISGLKHYVTGETDVGCPYTGFLYTLGTCNILYEDCVVTGHRVYTGNNSYAGSPLGTYDMSNGESCNITWRNVTQSNFFHLDSKGNPTDKISVVEGPGGWKCWGIMGSSYCKNLTYDNCKLTRFDAHCGFYNATIKDSQVGVVAVIGGGKLEITNTTIHYGTVDSNSIIGLRYDYGSTFSGDVILKDVIFKAYPRNKNGEYDPAGTYDTTINLFEAYWYNHNFGYKTYLPQNITIDNLVVESPKKVTDIRILHFKNLKTFEAYKDNINSPILYGTMVNKNPYEPIKSITIKNNTANYNYISPSEYGALFSNTVMTEKSKED